MDLGARVHDLTGNRYGKLTVLSYAGHTSDGKSKWLCKCDCGKEKVARAASLVAGTTKSCGCLYYETRKIAISKITEKKSHFYKHGMSKSRINNIYRRIKERCYNRNNPAFSYYGKRGITMCPEWKDDFMAFYKWSIENGYTHEMTIDRIDTNKGYSPDNCRWTTMTVQQNNRTNNVRVSYNGQEHTLSEWADIVGITKSTIYHRYERKWPVDKMLNTPQQTQYNRRKTA